MAQNQAPKRSDAQGGEQTPLSSENGGNELAVGLRSVHLLPRCQAGGKGYGPTTLSGAWYPLRNWSFV
jgi:hypothetical protein